MLGANRGLTGALAKFMAAPFVLLRVPPLALTLAGAIFSLVPAAFAYYQDWLWAGLSLLLVSGFDMVDGAVARATGRVTKFGGYLDSVLDRASDGIVLFGVGLGIGTGQGWLVVGACIVTSFLISYARARSFQDASPPPETWNQLFERPERVLFLVAALLVTAAAERLRPEADVLPGLLLIYAALALWTVVVRVWKVRKVLEQTNK